jgi:hypothetical protein
MQTMRNLWIIIWCWVRLLRGEPKSTVAVAALRKFFPEYVTPETISRVVREHG